MLDLCSYLSYVIDHHPLAAHGSGATRYRALELGAPRAGGIGGLAVVEERAALVLAAVATARTEVLKFQRRRNG
jgi:hypothetical protein